MVDSIDSELSSNNFHGPKNAVTNSIQSKAIKELKNAMTQGIKRNLDNMLVTLGIPFQKRKKELVLERK